MNAISLSDAIEIFAEIDNVPHRGSRSYDTAHRKTAQRIDLPPAPGTGGRGTVYAPHNLGALRLVQLANAGGFLSSDARKAMGAWLLAIVRTFPATPGMQTTRAQAMWNAALHETGDFNLTATWYPGLAAPIFAAPGLDLELSETEAAKRLREAAGFADKPPHVMLTLPARLILLEFRSQLAH